jgi:hypothetical protein
MMSLPGLQQPTISITLEITSSSRALDQGIKGQELQPDSGTIKEEEEASVLEMVDPGSGTIKEALGSETIKVASLEVTRVGSETVEVSVLATDLELHPDSEILTISNSTNYKSNHPLDSQTVEHSKTKVASALRSNLASGLGECSETGIPFLQRDSFADPFVDSAIPSLPACVVLKEEMNSPRTIH